MKKGIIALFVTMILFTLVACSDVNLKIEGSDKLELGFNEEYIVYLGNEEISSDDLLWTISDRTVLAANGNVMIPLKEGTCDITAVLKSNASVVAKKTVEVVDALIKSVTVKSSEGTTLYIAKDNFLNLEYTVEPLDASIMPVWSSSDESIATVDEDGLVTPISKGVVTIYCTCGKAVGELEINVKENITEITCNLPNHLVAGQGVELSFNIDDPIITIKDDPNNETSEMIGNVLFAKKVGTINFSVKSKSLPSLNKAFTIEVQENAFNSLVVQDTTKTKEVTEVLNKLSDTQKIGQYVISSTRANDLKEDADGVYYTDTYSKQIGKVYVNDIWGGREFGNFAISAINSREPLEGLAYFQSIAKYNSQIGGFIMISDYVAETTMALTTQISKIGQGKLTREQFYNYHSNYAKELKEFGVNFFFTYGYNYDDYASDTFSNDIVTNNYYTQILRQAYSDNGIMVGFTFASSGNNEIDKTKLIQMVNNNVELIAIEENIEKFEGSYSLVQYLRNTLNYKGLIFFNINFNDYIVTNNAFEPVTEETIDTQTNIANTIIKAMNEGADLFLAPTYINYSGYGSQNNNELLFEVYDKIIDAYKNNLISKDTVNNSVSRIISKKVKYNIVDGANIVPEELSDFSTYTTYAQSLYKSTYIISSTYQALDKTKNTVIFGNTFRDYGNYYSRVEYDFGTNMKKALEKEGFNSVKLNNNLAKTMDEELAALTENDQVIIMIQYSQYSYQYEDTRTKTDKQTGEPVIDEETGEPVTEKYKVYKNFMWYDVIQALYDRGVTNITIVVINDLLVADNMSYLNNRICANYNYTSDFKALVDVVIDGK